MKTSDIAIDTVFTILAAGGLGIPIYKYTKPTYTTPDDFIVLNTLPINFGVLQQCRVNVNIHCKDLAEGVMDIDRLKTLTASVVTLLDDVSGTKYMSDMESQEYHREEQLQCHYSNVRFNVKLIN